MMKKITCLLLLLVMTMPLFSCGKRLTVDETKTQLYVYVYDGGVGTDWLQSIKAKFEAKYADRPFQPGTSKKGVEIVIAPGKDALTSLESSPYNVIFTEQVFYNDLISQKQLLDITDIVAEKTLEEVSDGLETGTIEDKLAAEQKDAITALDGKYYVIPHYESYSGITYDVKVFEDNELFFREGGGWTNIKTEMTVGPDGIRTTYDDGLPSSYEEFSQLLTRMYLMGVIPFIWSGQYATYTNNLVTGAWAAYAGKEEFMLSFNFGTGNGKDIATEVVTGFDAENKPVTTNMTITPNTGYFTLQQAGRYYGLELLSTILSDARWYSDKIDTNLSHLDAQREYIYSDLEENPIGMIIEGSYWYNEAKNAFRQSENTYKEKAKNRRFAWMPLPRQVSGSVTEGNGTRNTVLDTLSSFGFINANIQDRDYLVDLAKLFLQYCYTDEAMIDFTLNTGLPKALQYTIPSKTVATMNHYYQSINQIRLNSDIIYPYSSQEIFINNQSSFSLAGTSNFWASTVSGTPYAFPFTAFKAGKSAQDYFKGMWKDPVTWETMYGQYF